MGTETEISTIYIFEIRTTSVFNNIFNISVYAGDLKKMKAGSHSNNVILNTWKLEA